VSEHDIVVHNFVPVVIGLTWLFGIGSVEFAGATVGVAILGAAIGIKLHKNRDGVDGQKDGGLRISFHGSPSPEDPEEFLKLRRRNQVPKNQNPNMIHQLTNH
jgi:hypothetical protein